MSRVLPALCLAWLLAGGAEARSVVIEEFPVMSWKEVQDRPLPPPGIRSVYGQAPQQFGELRLPPGEGPFPVVVLVHGGCWLNAFDFRYITHLAQALTDEGVATWTPEYRRLGDEGGGWPGTFVDVATATDHLRELIKDHALDLSRVISMGHSAGGQLALWLAARHQLPRESALFRPHPLRIKGVIGLAPISDLQSYRVGAPGSCNASVDRLLGGDPAQRPRRYARTSPLALLPLGAPQWLIQGARDPIVPVASVRAYAAAAQAHGERVKLLEQAYTGHFEPSMPETRNWNDVKTALTEALRQGERE